MSPFVPRKVIRGADRSLALGTFVLLFVCYVLSMGGLPASPSVEAEFQATRSLVRSGDISLGDTPESKWLLELREKGDPECRLLDTEPMGRQERWYPRVDAGQLLTSAPLYLVGLQLGRVFSNIESLHTSTAHTSYYTRPSSEYFEHLLVSLRGPLFGALIAALLLLCARRLQVSRLWSLHSALSLGLCTFLWPQVQANPGGVQTAFFAFLAVYLLLRVRVSFERFRAPSRLSLLGLGAALAMTLLSDQRTLPLFLVLTAAAEVLLRRGCAGLGTADRAQRARTVYLPVLVPVALALALFFLSAYWRTGGLPLQSVSLHLGTGEGGWLSLEKLGADFIAPGRGLLWFAPLICVLPFGLYSLRERGEIMVVRMFWLSLIAVLLSVWLGEGAERPRSYGPEGLLVILPVLWLIVALGLRAAWKRKFGRPIVGALALLGFIVQVPGVLVAPATHQDLAYQALQLQHEQETDAVAAGHPAEQSTLDWNLGFAVPWVHWRILRHRTAGLDEAFDAQVLFGLEGISGPLRPSEKRLEGGRHLTWMDWRRRLGQASWALFLVLGVLWASGLTHCVRSLSSARD